MVKMKSMGGMEMALRIGGMVVMVAMVKVMVMGCWYFRSGGCGVDIGDCRGYGEGGEVGVMILNDI